MAEKTATQKTDDTDASDQASASENKEDQDTGKDTTQNQQESGPKKGVEREFFKLREKKRELTSEIDQLRAQLAQVQENKSKGRGDDSSDDDNQTVNFRKELDAFKGEFIQELNGREEAKRIAAEEGTADQWLSSRQWIQEDAKFADGVAGLLHSKYADIAKIRPMAAARLAYQDVCDLKGVVDASPDLSEARAAGGAGTSAPSGASPRASLQDYENLTKGLDLSDPSQLAIAKKKLAELKKRG